MKRFYEYLFFVLYRGAKNASNPVPKYYGCMILSVIETLITIMFIHYAMQCGYLLLSESWEKPLIIIDVFTTVCFLGLNGLYFIKSGRFEKIIELYEAQERERAPYYSLHGNIVFGVVVVLMYCLYFVVPVKYAN